MTVAAVAGRALTRQKKSHMSFPILLILLISASLTIFSSCTPSKTDDPRSDTIREPKWWNHHLVLDSTHDFQIKWTNLDSEWMTMEMSASIVAGPGLQSPNSSNMDYLSVGFSLKGLDNGTDVVLGWVDEDPHLLDLHGVGDGLFLYDVTQNYQLLSGSKSNGITRIKFRRKWNTCDKDDDFHITDDTVRLSWSVGTSYLGPAEFNASFTNNSTVNLVTVTLPESRASGVRSVQLRVNNHGYEQFPEETPSGGLVPGENMNVWDIRGNNTVNGERTFYLSRIIKFPHDDNKRRHLIGFKPYIEDTESRLVHHMLFFGCQNVTDDDNLNQYLNWPGLDHFSKDFPAVWTKHCSSITFTWTIGSEGVMFPSNAGIPVSEKHNGCKYFLIQTHYDNPGLNSFTDHSGGRFYYTTDGNPRKDDAALFSVAHRVAMFQLIPPKMESYTVKAFCTTECTYKVFPETGITATHILLHAHLAATKMILRHIRNGVELPPIGVDNNFDPNYQEYRSINPPRIILPGDALVSECTYNTIARDNVTLGGVQAINEMCASFLLYYPKSPIAFCTSQPEFHSFFRTLNVDVGEMPILKKCSLPYDPRLNNFNLLDNVFELRHFTNTLEPADALDFINITTTSTSANAQTRTQMTLNQYYKEMDWKNGKWLEDAIYGNTNTSKHYAFCPGTKLENYITRIPNGVTYNPVHDSSCDYT